LTASPGRKLPNTVERDREINLLAGNQSVREHCCGVRHECDGQQKTMEEGFGWCDLNIVDGRRQSARDAYLTPALHRPNLDVVTSALVHRVSLNSDRCTGVDYSVGTDVFSVGCSGEVVLTAGTVGSAQLLLTSGIGPPSHLRAVGGRSGR
jgi:choline dehydrogenase-like flavoprotein